MKELKGKPGKDIAIFGGGELFRSLLIAGLVDDRDVGDPGAARHRDPVFPPPGRVTLKLRSQRVYKKTGTLGLDYDIVNATL